MVYFWHRSITWTEVFAEAGFIIPLSLLSLAYGTSHEKSKFLSVDCFGVGIFIIGTYINFASEYERYIWKLDSANQGHLYIDGFFQYSRHINYFGEILSFFGFALFCGKWNVWIPITMGVGMAMFSVPELDFYLNKRYPEEWADYTSKVPFNMVPFVW
jgi:steroid 5-alpha reductase family enzyme